MIRKILTSIRKFFYLTPEEVGAQVPIYEDVSENTVRCIFANKELARLYHEKEEES